MRNITNIVNDYRNVDEEWYIEERPIPKETIYRTFLRIEKMSAVNSEECSSIETKINHLQRQINELHRELELKRSEYQDMSRDHAYLLDYMRTNNMF